MISSLILNSKRSIVARFCSIPLFSSNFDASKSKSPSLSYLSKIWTIESPILIHYWSFNSLPIFIALKAMAFIRKLWYRTIKILSKKFKYFTYRSIYNFACFFCPLQHFNCFLLQIYLLPGTKFWSRNQIWSVESHIPKIYVKTRWNQLKILNLQFYEFLVLLKNSESYIIWVTLNLSLIMLILF